MKAPVLLLALLLAFWADHALAQEGFEASAGWRFLDLHFISKPTPLIPPALSASERAACGDVNAVKLQCAEPPPGLTAYRRAVQDRQRALEAKLDRMAQFPHSIDGTDFQLVLTRSGLARNQVPPALMRKIKTTRFIVAWQGSIRTRPREPYFPY